MMRVLMAACLCLSAVSGVAQTEVRADVGFSDSAFWTGAERTYQFRFAFETGNSLRFGLTFLKEGRLLYDGWGVEFALGRRRTFGAGFAGTVRVGAGLRMHSESSAHFHEGVPGEFRNSTWRTLRLNAPGINEAMFYPFVSYGIQHALCGPFFVDAQVRLSFHHTLTQWMWGRRDEPLAVAERRSFTFIPGYHLGLGIRF